MITALFIMSMVLVVLTWIAGTAYVGWIIMNWKPRS